MMAGRKRGGEDPPPEHFEWAKAKGCRGDQLSAAEEAKLVEEMPAEEKAAMEAILKAREGKEVAP
jgi:hypothetical protein